MLVGLVEIEVVGQIAEDAFGVATAPNANCAPDAFLERLHPTSAIGLAIHKLL